MLLSLLEARDHQLACDLDLDVLLGRQATAPHLPALQQALNATAGELQSLGMALWEGRQSQGRGDLAREAFLSADRVLSAIQLAQLESKRLTYVDSTDPSRRVTRATRELLDPKVYPNAKDHGLHRLKDLLQPEHLFELPAGEEFPPPASLNHRPNNLPVQVTSFIGRTADIDDLQVGLFLDPLA